MLERKLVYGCSSKRVISLLGRMYGSICTVGRHQDRKVLIAAATLLVAHRCYNCDTISRQAGSTSRENHYD